MVRTAAHIAALVEEARLPDRVRRRALAVFAALADAEGRLHRRPPEQVHFHEVGGLDAIVDVVGTCAALEVLDVDEVHASTVATGTGMVRSAHGLLPNPAPAVVELFAAVRRARPPGSTSAWSSRPRPGRPCSPRWRRASGRCRRWRSSAAASAPAPARSTAGPTPPRS